MPSEDSKHRATWMGFPSDDTIWKDTTDPVPKDTLELV